MLVFLGNFSRVLLANGLMLMLTVTESDSDGIRQDFLSIAKGKKSSNNFYLQNDINANLGQNRLKQ